VGSRLIPLNDLRLRDRSLASMDTHATVKLEPGSWQGARVLITGGLGFIGSNLAIRLVELGAEVTIIDAMMPEYGGNLFNVEPVRDRVRIHFGDICDPHAA
jgi:UDP-glucose 4-epimerase